MAQTSWKLKHSDPIHLSNNLQKLTNSNLSESQYSPMLHTHTKELLIRNINIFFLLFSGQKVKKNKRIDKVEWWNISLCHSMNASRWLRDSCIQEENSQLFFSPPENNLKNHLHEVILTIWFKVFTCHFHPPT